MLVDATAVGRDWREVETPSRRVRGKFAALPGNWKMAEIIGCSDGRSDGVGGPVATPRWTRAVGQAGVVYMRLYSKNRVQTGRPSRYLIELTGSAISQC